MSRREPEHGIVVQSLSTNQIQGGVSSPTLEHPTLAKTSSLAVAVAVAALGKAKNNTLALELNVNKPLNKTFIYGQEQQQ